VSKTINIIIKAVISLGFFVFIASFIEKNQLFLLFSEIRPFYLLLSFLMVPIMLCVSCLKWKILLDAGGSKITFLRLINIYLVGYFFSNLLPSTVGGDVARTFYAGKEIDNYSYAAVTVFIERFSGLILLLLLVIFAPLAKPMLYKNIYFILPALGSFVILFISLLVWIKKDSVYFSKTIPDRLTTVCDAGTVSSKPGIFHRIACKIRNLLDKVAWRLDKLNSELRRAVGFLRSDKILFTKVATLTLLFYFLTWVNVYIAYLTFGRSVEFIAMIALVPTIMLVSHLPVSFLGNLGFFESVFIFYFLMVGISGEETLAMSLLLRLKLLCLGGVGFVVYLMYKQVWGLPPEIQKEQDDN